MAFQEKKFLDAEGVTHLVKLLDEYPNNQILGSVIDAIEGELAQKYEKPSAGIPASDIAQGVIPDVPSWATAAQKPTYTASEVGALPSDTHIPSTTAELTNDAGFITSSALPTKVSDLTNDAGYLTQHQDISGKANSADLATVATSGDYADLNNKPTIPTIPVQDVQINGTSIVENEIANIPYATTSRIGAVQVGNGMYIDPARPHVLNVNIASPSQIKAASDSSMIKTAHQDQAVFYGLAKAAGDTTQSASSNAVGTYTDEAKASIQAMLGIDLSSIASQVEIPLVETVSGAAVTITGQPNTRYMCGEVTSISITPPSAGSIDVVFTSGSTVAVLTLPSTVKMPEWFDPTTLDTNTIYEILITDGVYGSVMTWAT